MTDQHPITPPPELVLQWLEDGAEDGEFGISKHIATQAANWGADQELEACCEWVSQFNYDDYSYQERLRAARRCPKPPSLKEEALQAAQRFYSNGHEDCNDEEVKDDFDIIRRALESLPD